VQTIRLGPVASQEAIKELGNNGGGFFNANSATPSENPTTIRLGRDAARIIIPFALTFTFRPDGRPTPARAGPSSR